MALRGEAKISHLVSHLRREKRREEERREEEKEKRNKKEKPRRKVWIFGLLFGNHEFCMRSCVFGPW